MNGLRIEIDMHDGVLPVATIDGLPHDVMYRVSVVMSEAILLRAVLPPADRATLRSKLAEVLGEPLTVKPMTDAERAWAVGDECAVVEVGHVHLGSIAEVHDGGIYGVQLDETGSVVLVYGAQIRAPSANWAAGDECEVRGRRGRVVRLIHGPTRSWARVENADGDGGLVCLSGLRRPGGAS